MKNFLKRHCFSIIFFIFALVEAGYIYYMTIEYKKLYQWQDSNVEKIDSLIDVINNRNDSIQYRIDTITIQLNNNKDEFKEEFNAVSDYPVEYDMVFFTEYLEEFKRRHPDNDYSE